MALYADDAVSMANNKPMLVGKAAIQIDIATSLANKAKGATIAYDVIDVLAIKTQLLKLAKQL